LRVKIGSAFPESVTPDEWEEKRTVS